MARPNGVTSRFILRCFPERQILIRGPGKISVLTLSTRVQTACAAAALLLVLALAGSAAGMVVSLQANARAAAAVSRLRLAEAASQAMMRRLQADDAFMAAARAQAQATAQQAIAAQKLALASLAHAQAKAASGAGQAASSQEMGQLIQQAQATLGQVKSIIKATGVNPDQLVAAPPPAAKATPGKQSALLMDQVNDLQFFGGMLAQLPLAAPVAQITVSSPFGYRPNPWTGIREFHVGVDLTGPIGTAVFATAPGVVVFAGVQTGYGKIIVIDHGYGLSTRYSHLQKMLVAVGDNVGLHQQIGLLGSTGWSTGPHLLYETRLDGQPYNPINFMKVSSNDVQN